MRRSSRRKISALDRLWRRLDRTAGKLNPFLAAISVGLLILNLTCFVAVKLASLMPAAPVPQCTPAEGVAAPPPER